ncbi:MAG: helix-turn-helix domain-containing protein [Desulfobacterales bacterium]|nr:helix-turn-helix domain-containing protein [Desulfobacterales bacterium]
MDDLDRYIEKRKKRSPKFAQNYDQGYEQFKIGALLKQARLDAGLTQEQVAIKLKTGKSAISRIENHAEDIRLSTLVNYAKAIGKSLKLEVA